MSQKKFKKKEKIEKHLLIDRLKFAQVDQREFLKGFSSSLWANVQEEAKNILKLIPYMVTLPAFEVSNVASFFYEGKYGTDWLDTLDYDADPFLSRWGMLDFPCLSPPFESFWMEYRRPDKIISGDGKILNLAKDSIASLRKNPKMFIHSQIGAAITYADHYKFNFDATNAPDEAFLSIKRTIWHNELISNKNTNTLMTGLYPNRDISEISNDLSLIPYRMDQVIPGVSKLIVIRLIFGDLEKPVNNVMSPAVTAVVCLDADGTPLRSMVLGVSAASETASIKAGESMDAMITMPGLIYPLLLAISFLHCQHKVVVEGTRNSAQKHYLTNTLKINPEDQVRFSTINIDTITKVLESEGDLANNGLKKALHKCRGHFKDYRKGSGLFGKYKQMVFVRNHLRGDKEKGEVKQIYQVNDSRFTEGS